MCRFALRHHPLLPWGILPSTIPYKHWFLLALIECTSRMSHDTLLFVLVCTLSEFVEMDQRYLTKWFYWIQHPASSIQASWDRDIQGNMLLEALESAKVVKVFGWSFWCPGSIYLGRVRGIARVTGFLFLFLWWCRSMARCICIQWRGSNFETNFLKAIGRGLSGGGLTLPPTRWLLITVSVVYPWNSA